MLTTPLGFRIVVRFARKPIWMPTAPSKLFRIPEHTFYDDEEIKQIRKLDFAYRAQMESIGKYMEKEFYIPATQTGGLPVEFLEKEKVEDREIYEENERLNAEVAQKRQAYFDSQLKEMNEKVMEEKLAREEALIQAAEKVDEFVKKHKDEPDYFVTPDNLDAMIERVLDNQVSYEYHIDRQGRRHGLAMAPQAEVKKQANSGALQDN